MDPSLLKKNKGETLFNWTFCSSHCSKKPVQKIDPKFRDIKADYPLPLSYWCQLSTLQERSWFLAIRIFSLSHEIPFYPLAAYQQGSSDVKNKFTKLRSMFSNKSSEEHEWDLDLKPTKFEWLRVEISNDSQTWLKCLDCSVTAVICSTLDLRTGSFKLEISTYSKTSFL